MAPIYFWQRIKFEEYFPPNIKLELKDATA